MSNQQNIAGALTYPSVPSGSQAPVAVQPRQPRNLQGLLRFAMEATKAEDAPGNSELGPMDEERRKFLEEALKSLTVDIAKVIHDAIKVLTNTEKIRNIQLGQELPEDVQTSFQNLLDFVDDIDVANDFYKMGGLAVFPVCYGSENDGVRALASTLLAEVCQNNPFCQAQVLECGLLHVLLNLVQSERGNALAKCLYAISCITREYPPACKELVSAGGCAVLTECVEAPEATARTKAAFLIRHLCTREPSAKDQFINLNLVKVLAEQIKKGHDETTEHLLSVLQVLVNDMDTTVLNQCRDPSLKLKSILEDHLKRPELNDDTYLEEKEYAQDVLEKVFANYKEQEQDYVDEVADR